MTFKSVKAFKSRMAYYFRMPEYLGKTPHDDTAQPLDRYNASVIRDRLVGGLEWRIGVANKTREDS